MATVKFVVILVISINLIVEDTLKISLVVVEFVNLVNAAAVLMVVNTSLTAVLLFAAIGILLVADE